MENHLSIEDVLPEKSERPRRYSTRLLRNKISGYNLYKDPDCVYTGTVPLRTQVKKQIKSKYFTVLTDDQRKSLPGKSSLSYHHMLTYFKCILPEDEVFCKSWIRTIFIWVHCSGPEWTVGVLKSLKTDLQQMANQYEVYPHNLATPQIARSKRGTYKGIVGSMFHIAKSGPEAYQAIYNLLMTSTAIFSDEPLDSQIQKFLSAVEIDTVKCSLEASPKSQLSPRQRGYLPSVKRKVVGKKLKDMNTQVSDIKQTISVTKELISAYGYPEQITYESILSGFPQSDPIKEDNVIISCLEFFNSQKGKRLMEQPFFQRLVKQHWKEVPMLLDVFSSYVRTADGTNGEILLTQEGGLKGRFYLNPKMVFQVMLQGLKVSLGNWAKQLPFNLVVDQRRADCLIQKALDQGLVVSCVDLSNASDLIPWTEQKYMLETLYPQDKDLISLYDFINALPAKFKYDPEDPDRLVVWSRGQALGTGPSFSAFSLWHGLQAWRIAEEWRKENHLPPTIWDDYPPFFIVGDDIFILIPEIAKRYKAMLVQRGLEYSERKTLEGSSIAEFTGYVFQRDRKPFQAKKMKHLNNDTKVAAMLAYGAHTVDTLWNDRNSTEIERDILRSYYRYHKQQVFYQDFAGFDTNLDKFYVPNKYGIFDHEQLQNKVDLDEVCSGPYYLSWRRLTSTMRTISANNRFMNGLIPSVDDQSTKEFIWQQAPDMFQLIQERQHEYRVKRNVLLNLPQNIAVDQGILTVPNSTVAKVPAKPISRAEKEAKYKGIDTYTMILDLVNNRKVMLGSALGILMAQLEGHHIGSPSPGLMGYFDEKLLLECEDLFSTMAEYKMLTPREELSYLQVFQEIDNLL